MLEHAYADAFQIAREALGVLMPPERQTVAEYALQHRFLSNQGGGYVGRWHHDKAPYLVAPMETLTSLDYLTVAVPGPGQSGKTEIAQNWFLKAVSNDPADMLWYMQTDPGVEAFVKGRINPQIDGHAEMSTRLGGRPVDDSLHFKQFSGMHIEFLSAAHNNLINKSAPRIVADEIDAYPKDLGDIKALLDVRRQTFGRYSMLLAMSHPDMARGLVPERDWTAGVMAIYADSDRRIWYWPCPHCGAWSSPAPISSRYMALEYPEGGTLDDVEREARLICPVNGCKIEDKDRRAMNLAAFRSSFGGWIGDGQEISQDGRVTGELVARKTAGFWIVGAMSPFILGGIGALARAKAKAEREFEVTGDDLTLKQVTVKQFGFPYATRPGAGSMDANDLADRAERELQVGFVPEGGRFITVSVDCQIAHWEYIVRVWGERGESWVIEKGRIAGDPATSEEDWDQVLALFERSWPLADNSGRRMKVRGAGYDSHGQPGVTQQAYEAWTRWRRARKVKFFGKLNGRDVFDIIPLRGGKPSCARLSVTYPDTSRKSNVVAAAGQVPVGTFNPNQFKDDLAGQLLVAAPGPKYVHVPHAFRSKQAPHVWFEQLTSEERLREGRWEKKVASVRNEALDLMVMSHVVAHLHGLRGINWDRPPEWARPWDSNPMVIAAEEPIPTDPSPPPADAALGATVQTVEPEAKAAPRKSLASRLA